MGFKYLSALDRPTYGGPPQATGGQGSLGNLEDPIITVGELGVTVPEHDQRTGGHIVQTVQAAIRSGAKDLQLMMMTPHTSAMGGRPKAYGKEVRQAIKEVAKAGGVNIKGLEMPTSSMSAMSGFDSQRGQITEKHRQEAMEEVRDALNFMADISDGGGVDIFSQEFPRTIFDEKWNEDVTYMENGERKTTKMFEEYVGEGERAVKHLVDNRTGQLIQGIAMDKVISYPIWKKVEEGNKYIDRDTGKEVVAKKLTFVDYENRKVEYADRVPEWDDVKKEFKLRKMKIENFSEEAEILTKIRREEFKADGKPFDEKLDGLEPHEAFFVGTLKAQEAIARGWMQNYGRNISETKEELGRMRKAYLLQKRIEDNATDSEKKFMMQTGGGTIAGIHIPGGEAQLPSQLLLKEMERRRRDLRGSIEMAKGQQQTAEDYRLQQQNIRSAEKYAKQKSIESYADLGLFAYQETKNRDLSKPLYVGPEIGWPGSWGGHPKEFVELIIKSREKLVEHLQAREGLTKREAKEAARQHVAGCFDTGHMGMWLQKFRRLPEENEQERIKKFNSWYMDMTDYLVKKEVVGHIQAVDSMTGAHGHLPPGQGIFPVKDAVLKFKEFGWKGWIVSEGHEEEKFGANRILTKTWETFGSPVTRSGLYGAPQRWADVSGGYQGNTYPPYFITQSYVPVNDFKLWSEVQLE